MHCFSLVASMENTWSGDKEKKKKINTEKKRKGKHRKEKKDKEDKERTERRTL